MQSYAFLKSTLKNKQGIFLIFALSTTSFVTITLWRSCLPLTKALWKWSITFPITFLILFARVFEKILYKHPTKEIGLMLSRDWGLSNFAIKAINDELVPLGKILFLWNSFKNLKTSSFIISQNSLMKMKLNQFRSGLFDPSHSHLTCFTSSSPNKVNLQLYYLMVTLPTIPHNHPTMNNIAPFLFFLRKLIKFPLF